MNAVHPTPAVKNAASAAGATTDAPVVIPPLVGGPAAGVVAVREKVETLLVMEYCDRGTLQVWGVPWTDWGVWGVCALV